MFYIAEMINKYIKSVAKNTYIAWIGWKIICKVILILGI